MFKYIDSIPLEDFSKYKYVIYKVTEYIERGFSSSEEVLCYFASKGEATIYVKNLPNYNERIFYIKTIGVK